MGEDRREMIGKEGTDEEMESNAVSIGESIPFTQPPFYAVGARHVHPLSPNSGEA